MKKIAVRKVARIRLTSTVTSTDGCNCVVSGA